MLDLPRTLHKVGCAHTGIVSCTVLFTAAVTFSRALPGLGDAVIPQILAVHSSGPSHALVLTVYPCGDAEDRTWRLHNLASAC